MPEKFTYQGRKGFTLLPEGDYLVTITGAKEEYSQGAKTKGATIYVLDMVTEDGAPLDARLLFHPSCEWKIDTALVCFGFNPEKGKELELTPASFVGRRGWVHVTQRKFQKKEDKAGEPTGTANEVAAYLDRAVPEEF